MRVLITGAGGFVGQYLSPFLQAKQHEVLAVTRQRKALLCDAQICYTTATSNWVNTLTGVDAVVHLANVAHRQPTDVDQSDYQYINVEQTRQLVQAAKTAGVKHFIYISSIKVHGDDASTPLVETSPLMPTDAYAQSKCEAEALIQSELTGSDTTWTILRPPLIYGLGVKGNMAQLLHWVKRRRPLPLRCFSAPRAMIGVHNFCDAIATCLTHPKAANEIFVLSDAQVYSLAQFVQMMGQVANQPVRAIWIPSKAWMARLMTWIGKSEQWSRLTQPLYIDMSHIQSTLHWRPPHSVCDGLAQMVLGSCMTNKAPDALAAPEKDLAGGWQIPQ